MSQTGYDYAPKGKPAPVCRPGEFKFAAVALDHGHIYGQCNGLVEAGGELCWVFDPDPLKVEEFRKKFPQVKVAKALDQVLEDPGIQLAAAAAIPSERGPLGVQVMRAGKHYFTDKTPFTELRATCGGATGGGRDWKEIHGLLQRTSPCRMRGVRR